MDIYKNMGIYLHTKDYIRKQGNVQMPANIDESKLGKLPFHFGFYLNDTPKKSERDVLSGREVQNLTVGFQDMLVATNRFASTRTNYGNNDEANEKYFLRVMLTFTKSSSQKGSLVTDEFKLLMSVIPTEAISGNILDFLPPFQCHVSIPISKKVSKDGFVIAGIDTAITAVRQKIHTELIKMAFLQMLNHIYTQLPAGGPVVVIDDRKDEVLIKADETTGLLPKQEMVIYARRKNQREGFPIPLYNASLVSIAKKGHSTLHIWRRNSGFARVQKILEMIRTDWEQAKEQYDFWAASDGIADKPDFIFFEELK